MSNYGEIPAGDQEAFEHQVMREKWWEEQDRQYQVEEEYFLLNMKLDDFLEAIENMDKFEHQLLWNAMREEDFMEMRDVVYKVCKNYASKMAHQKVDRRVR